MKQYEVKMIERIKITRWIKAMNEEEAEEKAWEAKGQLVEEDWMDSQCVEIMEITPVE